MRYVTSDRFEWPQIIGTSAWNALCKASFSSEFAQERQNIGLALGVNSNDSVIWSGSAVQQMIAPSKEVY